MLVEVRKPQRLVRVTEEKKKRGLGKLEGEKAYNGI